MIEAITIILVVIIIGVNLLVTMLPRFRRWIYKDKK